MSMKNYLYLLLILTIFAQENKASFDIEKVPYISEEFYNKEIYDNPSRKWFLIFIVENCNYCNHVLKSLKDIGEPITNDYHIKFGIVNCSYSQNLWLGLAFNLTQMPTMVYIENQKYFLYKDFFDQKQLSKFLEQDFSDEESNDLPVKITFFYKASIAFDKLVSGLQQILQNYLNKKGYNFQITRTIVICAIAIFFISLMYIEAKLTSSIGKTITNLCKRNNNNTSDVEEVTKNQEIPNGKEKKE